MTVQPAALPADVSNQNGEITQSGNEAIEAPPEYPRVVITLPF